MSEALLALKEVRETLNRLLADGDSVGYFKGIDLYSKLLRPLHSRGGFKCLKLNGLSNLTTQRVI